ncbi:transposase [Candidatus Binatia bacterium]|nr:transposase [Candidatus Binatia bacterium]
MTGGPEGDRRRSIRLKGYDYQQQGGYFITICTQNRAFLFGDVVNGDMRLNDAGRLIQSVWNDMPTFYRGVETDEFVVMPNHVHGIIVLVRATPRGRPDGRDDAVGATPRGRPDGRDAVGATPRGRPDGRDAVGATPRGRPDGRDDAVGATPRGRPDGRDAGQARGPAPTMSLGDVVHRFKTMTTRRYADAVKQSGWPAFAGRLWQRNYYEHIIRNEESLNRIRRYILDNPARWASDRENPQATSPEPEQP